MQKKRKAQVTVFIILGIIIVAGILIFFFTKQETAKKQEIPPETQPIYSFVEECIRQTGIEGVYAVGKGGGYRNNYCEECKEDSVSVYYYIGKNNMPTKGVIQDEISNYIKEKIPNCINNFKNFPDYQIKQEEIKPQVTILDNNVIINAEYPILITKEKTTSFSEFKDIEIPIRLGLIYDSVKNIIDSQVQSNADALCLSCLEYMTDKNNLSVTLEDHPTELFFIKIIDNNTKINNMPYEFIYGEKYTQYEGWK